MRISFTAEVIEWRGPAPFLFAAIPQHESDEIKLIAPRVTYGWGVLPVQAKVGRTEFKTALFPRDGIYLLPLKVAIQKAEGIEIGDVVTAALVFDVAR